MGMPGWCIAPPGGVRWGPIGRDGGIDVGPRGGHTGYKPVGPHPGNNWPAPPPSVRGLPGIVGMLTPVICSSMDSTGLQLGVDMWDVGGANEAPVGGNW